MNPFKETSDKMTGDESISPSSTVAAAGTDALKAEVSRLAAELREAQDALLKTAVAFNHQKDLLESIIDNLPFNIYIVDRNLTVVAWNRKREYGPFGISRDVAIGAHLWNILDMNLFKTVTPKDRDEIAHEFEEAFKTGRLVEREEVSTSFGDKRFFKVLKIPLVIKGSEPSYVITALEDITDKRQMETQMMARERLAAIGELAAGVAHEINNPMASMAVCVDSLLRRFKKDYFKKDEDYEKFHSYLKIIEDEIYRCKNITTGLLDFSRERSLIVKLTNINETLTETIKLLHLQKKYREHIVKMSLEEELPSIPADAGQLRQVFLAIAINAFESMSPGGLLHVTTVSDYENNEKIIRIKFQDNGCGISRENLKKIFQTFFTTKGVHGTGLGLSICYGIIQQHGGRIDVESELGKGSAFTLILPVDSRRKEAIVRQ